MVTPEARRELVQYTQEEYGISERQACKMFGISRSVNRYRKKPDRNQKLRKRLRKLAAKRNRWGCPLLLKTLRREGWDVNHKRVERLYREENLALMAEKGIFFDRMYAVGARTSRGLVTAQNSSTGHDQ